MKISFEKKLFFVFCFIMIIVFAFSAIIYRNNLAVINSNYWVSHTQEVLYRSEKVLSFLKDIETGSRGFIITHDSTYLVPYDNAQDSIAAQIKKLSGLIADNRGQVPRVDSLNRLAVKRLLLSNTVTKIELNKNGDNARLVALMGEGKIVMDDIRKLVAEIEAEENALLRVRDKLNNENSDKLKNTFFIVFGSTVLIFVIVYFIVWYYFKEDSKFQLGSKFKFFTNHVDDIIEGISDPFFAVDENWKFIYLNTAAKKKMGYDKGPLTGKNIFDVFSHYSETVIGKNLRLVKETQQPVSFEAYDDFFEHWEDFTIYPTAEGLTVYIKDATERKANETELLRTTQFLEETNEVAMVGGWEADLQKGTLYWTSVTKLIHGAPLDFIPDLKKGIDFYKEGKSRDTITELVNNAIEKGLSFDAALQIITVNGNEKWVRAKGKPVFENNQCTRIYGTFQDIDEQKKLDDKLNQSEKQFRSAFEYSAVGMALITADGKWKEVNEALYNIVGYSQAELSALTFQDITYPEDLDTNLKLLQELIKEKRQSYQLEKRYIHKDGHIVWILLAVSMVKDSYGQIVHFIAQIQDINEQKLSQKALLAERKLLKTIIDNLPLNVYLKDLQSKKILANKSELDYMGAANEQDILGKGDYDLYPDYGAAISIEEDQYVFKTGKSILNKETLSFKNDGTETWFLSSKIPFINEQNEITGLLGISFDITVRNQMNRALEAVKQKLSTLFDLSPVGFALSEYKSGRFIEVNRAFATKLGYTTEELKNLDRLRIKPEKYWAREVEIIQALNKDHNNFGPLETEHIRKDGSTYPILLNGLKIIDADGKELIWTVTQDITNLKEKEAQLKILNTSIEETNKALAIKNEELEQFAYIASHDLQEPLRIVTGFMSLLEKKYNSILDDDGKKYIQFAINGATRMRQLITDILDYSRLGTGVASKLMPVDLNLLVQEIIETRVNNAEDKKVAITVDKLPVINADKTSMEQLFSNLITNAIKYQVPGNTPIVKVTVEDNNDHWKFSVADNGIGIEPQYFNKVFNVFQRLHTRENYSGTGIGLAICKKIVNSLKGEIWVKSVPGNGTTFYFTVPKESVV